MRRVVYRRDSQWKRAVAYYSGVIGRSVSRDRLRWAWQQLRRWEQFRA